MRTIVIGLGEIGSQTFEELHKQGADVIGVDINDQLVAEYVSKGYKAQTTIPESDHYIIAVYLTEHIFDVLGKIERKDSLVTLESTIDPGAISDLKGWASQNNTDLIAFPHRFNPSDQEHHVFNLDRVIGGVTPEATDKAINFYSQYMSRELMHPVSFETAIVSKPLENWYRGALITIAQEIKSACNEKGLDYQEVISAMNTKWNIDVLQPRDGVKGKCIPKDMALIANFFELFPTFREMITANQIYISEQ